MQFLSGSELTKAIKVILKEPNVRCAVAFWGEKCEQWLKGKNARVICNLLAGGTNPYALEKLVLPSKNLKQYDALHAKVFIGKSYSIIASANVSSNGLGFENQDFKGLYEAGTRIETTEEIVRWFEDLWKNKDRTRPIKSKDWKEAKRKWDLRQKIAGEMVDLGNSKESLFEACRNRPDRFNDTYVICYEEPLCKDASKAYREFKSQASSSLNSKNEGGSTIKRLVGSTPVHFPKLPKNKNFIMLGKTKNGIKFRGVWRDIGIYLKVDNDDDPLTVLRRHKLESSNQKFQISSSEKLELIKLGPRVLRAHEYKTLPELIKMPKSSIQSK